MAARAGLRDGERALRDTHLARAAAGGAGSGLGAGARAAEHGRAAAARSAEDLAEDVAEDVAEVPARAGRGVRIDAGVAVLVVGRALLRVAEHLVGFLRFLEVLFGARVLRIAVRMPFHGKAPVGLLQVFLGGVAVDAEHFAVVALRHSAIPHKRTGPARSPCVTP